MQRKTDYIFQKDLVRGNNVAYFETYSFTSFCCLLPAFR